MLNHGDIMSKTKKETTDFEYLKQGLEYFIGEHRIMTETLKEMRKDLKLLDIDIEKIQCGPLKENALELKKQIIQNKEGIRKRLALLKDDTKHLRSIAHKIKRIDKVGK